VFYTVQSQPLSFSSIDERFLNASADAASAAVSDGNAAAASSMINDVIMRTAATETDAAKRRSRTDSFDMSAILKSESTAMAVGSPTEVDKKPLIGILLNRSPRRRASFGVR